MEKFTSTMHAEIFSQPGTRVKRHVREFFGPDPDDKAGQQRGVARKLTIDQSFTLFLGGHLIGTLKFSVPEAIQICEDLKSWLNKIGLFPISLKGWARFKEAGIIQSWTVEIVKLSLKSADGKTGDQRSHERFRYVAKGFIDRVRFDEELPGVDFDVYTERYATDTLSTRGKPGVLEERSPIDVDTFQLLHLTDLVRVYVTTMAENGHL